MGYDIALIVVGFMLLIWNDLVHNQLPDRKVRLERLLTCTGPLDSVCPKPTVGTVLCCKKRRQLPPPW